MHILIGAARRSGSTALFNFVRLICEQHGRVYGCFEDEYREDIADQHNFTIVKAHKYKEDWVNWADVVFTIFREPNEIKESMERFAEKGGKAYDEQDLLRGLAWWGHYNYHASYAAHFNQLGRSPGNLVKNLAATLNLKVNTEAVLKLFDQIKPPKVGIDRVTLLHANHRTR